MKRLSAMLPVVISLGLITFSLFIQPRRTSAGGLPCFLCHSTQFQGSDIAPSVADTKLTDEQIMAQMRHPRGVMPAFPEFANQGIVDLIRSMPTGQPTATLAPEWRSEALATIAAVAATRATEYARPGEATASQTPTPYPATDTPEAVTLGAASPVQTPDKPSRSGIGTFLLPGISGLLAVAGAIWWAKSAGQRGRTTRKD